METDPLVGMLATARETYERGDTSQALVLFREIVQRYPDSGAAGTAREYIAAAGHVAKSRQEGGAEQPVQRVTVVDLDIGFMSLVGLFIKAAFAIIPAALLVAIVYYFALAMLAGAFRGY